MTLVPDHRSLHSVAEALAVIGVYLTPVVWLLTLHAILVHWMRPASPEIQERWLVIASRFAASALICFWFSIACGIPDIHIMLYLLKAFGLPLTFNLVPLLITLLWLYQIRRHRKQSAMALSDPTQPNEFG